MSCRVDRRTIRFEPDDEAIAEVVDRREAWLAGEFLLARLFWRIDRKAAYVREKCASTAEFGARRGYDRERVRQLALLGYALDGVPDLEQALRDNQIGFVAAREIGRVYRDPRCVQEDDQWLDWATQSRLKDLQRRIRERIEAVRQGVGRTRTFTAAVTDRTRDNLDRCRGIASTQADQLLTNGQLLDIFSTRYLLDEDPTLVEARPRRMPPTVELPHERGIASEVVRAIWLRSGGLCEFGCCDRPIAQLCHLEPHRDGSPREVQDLVGGCRLHHKLYDKEWIRHRGWTPDGLPTFVIDDTFEVLMPKPRPEKREDLDPPLWLLRALGPRRRKKLERLRKRAREAAFRALEEAAAVTAATMAEDPSPPVRTDGPSATEPPPPRDAASRPPRFQEPDGGGSVGERGPPSGQRA